MKVRLCDHETCMKFKGIGMVDRKCVDGEDQPIIVNAQCMCTRDNYSSLCLCVCVCVYVPSLLAVLDIFTPN